MLNKKSLLAVIFVCGSVLQAAPAVPTVVEVQEHAKLHPQHVMAAVAAALLARPVYDLMMQWYNGDENKAYGLASLLGLHLGIKPETDKKSKRLSVGVSVGGADLKVVAPVGMPKTVAKKVKSMLSAKGVKRNAQEFLGILNDFCPRLVLALEARKSPVISDGEVAAKEKAKRLIAEFSCGTFRVRGGFDLAEAVLVPASTVISYMLYQLSQKQGLSAYTQK